MLYHQSGFRSTRSSGWLGKLLTGCPATTGQSISQSVSEAKQRSGIHERKRSAQAVQPEGQIETNRTESSRIEWNQQAALAASLLIS